MISFGELRKRSLEWHMDLADVERVYATSWLLKGIFSQAALNSLILRGASALRYAFTFSYPLPEMPEFLLAEPMGEADLTAALAQAASAATEMSGLSFAFENLARSSAKVKFAGPLGRRSAAQPHIGLSFIPGKSRLAPTRMPLVHPFSDECAATLSVVAIEELIGERLARLPASPRARDVYDLWFAATQLQTPINWEQARTLAQDLAAERNTALPRPEAIFSPGHRARLVERWDSSLRNIPRHPAFEQVEKDLARIL